MATTLSNVTMPIQLQQEAAPTIDGLISRIDPWVLYHLKSTILSDVHYENQLYGPINSFIGSVFPTGRRYMTIPQALLRRSIPEGEADEGDISIGSIGGLHESRNLEGNEIEKMFPDFLTVKVRPTLANLPRLHTAVCIVEVKRDDLTARQAEKQLTLYMERVSTQRFVSDDFRGYLVMGKKVIVYGRDPNPGVGEPGYYRHGEFSMLDDNDPFTRDLSQISVNNWNTY